MFWLKKKDSAQALFEADKRERLFFHDLVNHTHGLILYLNQKSAMQSGVEHDEIPLIEKEIRTLQSLIKDHFHFKHKNLLTTYDWVSFSVAELALNSLIKMYFSEQKVKTFVQRSGKISYEKSLQERESAVVYFPVFYRIMNNIIKNISEAGSDEVYFVFTYYENGFLIETRNKINSDAELKRKADNISQIILGESKIDKNSESIESGMGLGLESVHHLAEEIGGRFDFEISQNFWINKITLPVPQQNRETKKAA